jgi:hypothetical protein
MNRMLGWQLAGGCILVLEVGCQKCPPNTSVATSQRTYARCAWQTNPQDPTKKLLVCRADDGTSIRVDTTGADSAGLGGP